MNSNEVQSPEWLAADWMTEQRFQIISKTVHVTMPTMILRSIQRAITVVSTAPSPGEKNGWSTKMRTHLHLCYFYHAWTIFSLPLHVSMMQCLTSDAQEVLITNWCKINRRQIYKLQIVFPLSFIKSQWLCNIQLWLYKGLVPSKPLSTINDPHYLKWLQLYSYIQE